MPKTMPGVFNFERELPESNGPTGGDKVFGLFCVRPVSSSATVHTSLFCMLFTCLQFSSPGFVLVSKMEYCGKLICKTN